MNTRSTLNLRLARRTPSPTSLLVGELQRRPATCQTAPAGCPGKDYRPVVVPTGYTLRGRSSVASKSFSDCRRSGAHFDAACGPSAGPITAA